MSNGDSMTPLRRASDAPGKRGVIEFGGGYTGPDRRGVRAPEPSLRQALDRLGEVVFSQEEVDMLLGTADRIEKDDRDDDAPPNTAYWAALLIEASKALTIARLRALTAIDPPTAGSPKHGGA